MKAIRNFTYPDPTFEGADEDGSFRRLGILSMLPAFLNRHFRPILSLSLDVVALILAFAAAYATLAFTVWEHPFSWATWAPDAGAETIMVILTQLGTMFFLGGYDFSHRVFLARRLSRRIVGLFIGAILGIFFMVFVLLAPDVHRLATLLQVCIAVPGLALTSILVRRIYLLLGRRSVALIVTETKEGGELAQELLEIAQSQYNQVEIVTIDEYERDPRSFDQRIAASDCCVFEVAGGKNEAFRLQRAVHAQSPKELTSNLDEFYSRITGYIHNDSTETHGVNAAFNNGNLRSLQFQVTQRIRDFVLSLFGLILTAPLWPVIALAIKLDSKGPIFFRQERVGQFKRPFHVLKFRTMVADADKTDSPRWATVGDERITGIGAVLRKTRLDELPQLLNVLRGDMNIVGPRPIREHFADEFTKKIPSYHLRFIVKPGLTGWAQLRYKYPLSADDQLQKFRYDMFYLSQVSHDFDLGIMLGTLKTLLRRSGV